MTEVRVLSSCIKLITKVADEEFLTLSKNKSFIWHSKDNYIEIIICIFLNGSFRDKKVTVSGVTINCPMLELCKIVFSWTNRFWRYMDILETYLVDMGTWAGRGRRSSSRVIISLYRAGSSIPYIFWQSTINTVFSQDGEMAGLVLRVQSSQVFELLGAKHSQNTSIPCTLERKGF